MAKTQQQIIAGFMDRLDPLVESPSMTGMSTMTGSASIPQDSNLDVDGDAETRMLTEPEPPSDEEFTEQELKIAKRFVELMGSADKARAAVDKVDEYQECLGLLDDEDEQERDGNTIEKLAGMMPGLPDLPMELSGLYNPSAGSPSM